MTEKQRLIYDNGWKARVNLMSEKQMLRQWLKNKGELKTMAEKHM